MTKDFFVRKWVVNDVDDIKDIQKDLDGLFEVFYQTGKWETAKFIEKWTYGDRVIEMEDDLSAIFETYFQ